MASVLHPPPAGTRDDARRQALNGLAFPVRGELASCLRSAVKSGAATPAAAVDRAVAALQMVRGGYRNEEGRARGLIALLLANRDAAEGYAAWLLGRGRGR